MMQEKNNPTSANNNFISTEKQSEAKISRRNFLTSSGVAAVGLGVIGGRALVAADAWTSGALDKYQSATLLLMVRDLYPNDDLEDIYYANVILPMGEKAAEDPAVQKQLSEGAFDLDACANKRFGKNYTDLEKESERVQILKEIEATDFFADMRSAVELGIYNNPELWLRLGYGGSSWEEGGYINRGFDDIDWLEG